MLEFTWLPSYDATKTVAPNAKVIKFGDGYEQRQASGINSRPRKFALKFTRRVEVVDEIELFLLARCAIEAFKYTHPGQATGVFVCREWVRTNVALSVDSLSATFEEVYE